MLALWAQEIMNGGVNNEVVENGGDAVQNGEPEEPIRSIWFVRVPRPDNDDRSVELAQQEFDMHLATCRLLNENRRLKKVRIYSKGTYGKHSLQQISFRLVL